jgi:hypothetical protein
MSCVHLKKLYALCSEEGMRISSSELIRFVCTQCGEQEVCPSILLDQYDALHQIADPGSSPQSADSEQAQEPAKRQA